MFLGFGGVDLVKMVILRFGFLVFLGVEGVRFFCFMLGFRFFSLDEGFLVKIRLFKVRKLVLGLFVEYTLSG